MVDHLKALFPRLTTAAFRVTSPRDPLYNCVAWAAGITNDWWWPHADPEEAFWPEGGQRVRTLESFQAAFAPLGYVMCAGEELETGFEKVAVFANASRLPMHAARKLPTGWWTSKLGEGEDIEHWKRHLRHCRPGLLKRTLRK